MDEDNRRAARLLGELILTADENERENLLQHAIAAERPRTIALTLAAAVAMVERAVDPEQLRDIAQVMMLDPDLD